mgnify:CR=1 FL=1
MLRLNRVVAGILTLGSSAVLAGTMGAVCKQGNLMVPCENTAWEVGGEALYLQPIYSVDGNEPRTSFGGDNAGGYTPMPNANWSWGFMIDGVRHWGKGKDLTLSWYHVNHASAFNNVNYPIVIPGEAALGTYNVPERLNLHPQWDAANVEFGRTILLDEQQNLRFQAGIQYARLVTKLSGYTPQGFYTSTGGNTETIAAQIQSMGSDFNGVGPRGGLGFQYGFPYGFSLYGSGAAGLLVGTASFSNDRISVGTATLNVGNSTNTGSRTMVIPELEAKAGLQYHYALAGIGKIQSQELTLDAGWMIVNYFQGQMFGTNENGRSASVYPNRTNVDQTNFALQGLYFGATWLGNV